MVPASSNFPQTRPLVLKTACAPRAWPAPHGGYSSMSAAATAATVMASAFALLLAALVEALALPFGLGLSPFPLDADVARRRLMVFTASGPSSSPSVSASDSPCVSAFESAGVGISSMGPQSVSARTACSMAMTASVLAVRGCVRRVGCEAGSSRFLLAGAFVAKAFALTALAGGGFSAFARCAGFLGCAAGLATFGGSLPSLASLSHSWARWPFDPYC